jgi:hypothetical protein
VTVTCAHARFCHTLSYRAPARSARSFGPDVGHARGGRPA